MNAERGREAERASACVCVREGEPGVLECGKRERGRQSECKCVHERERVTRSI